MTRISYNHAPVETAADYDHALRCVQEQALAVDGPRWSPVSAVNDLTIVVAPDGAYVYLSPSDADHDDTGEHAFACISEEVSR